MMIENHDKIRRRTFRLQTREVPLKRDFLVVHQNLSMGSEGMRSITQGIRFPDEQIYKDRLLAWVEQAMERWKDCPMMTDTARQQAALLLAHRLETVAGQVLQALWEQRMREKNPVLELDIRLAAVEEKKLAADTLLAELEQTGDRLLFERWPLLREELERSVARFNRWLAELLDRSEEHREEISQEFFGGGDFGPITGLSADQADLHFHGRSAAVVRTEDGAFLYKPRGCGLDDFYYRLVERWFSDITRAPKTVLGQGYGFCEFIPGKRPSSPEDLSVYFTNFGGLCALFQALGSSDLHYENFIAQGRYPVLVDVETLLTPSPKVWGDPEIFPDAPPRQEDFISDQNRSLYPSSLLPSLQGDTQMSPLLAPSLPAVWGYEEDFFLGFSKIYDRCMELRDQLAEFLQEAGTLPVRRLLRQSAYYGQLLKHLYSPAALTGPKARERLPAKLGGYFQRLGARRLQSIADWEAKCLYEGDIPYFSCRGDGMDLLGYGQVVTAGFFCQSPLDNARERLGRLSQQEKQFEMNLLRQSLESALRPVPKEEQIVLPAPEGAEQPLHKKEALAQAEEIFRQLRDRAVTSPSGEVGWYVREGDKGRFTYARPVLSQGTAGLGVFFAGVYRATANAELESQAKELCQVVLDQVCRHLSFLEKAWKILERVLPLGLSDGTAGILKSLAIMGRCLRKDTAGPFIDRLMSLLDRIQIAEYSQLDVMSGAAGLIQVLCGYEELSSHPLTPKVVKACVDKLLAAKTLESKSGHLLWDTLNLGRPISGMGHGTAGIGASLQMAGTFLHQEDCLQAARDALEWEYQTYCEKLGTWPDFRGSSLGEHFMHGYCSGAPGLGLAMLLYENWGESGPLQQENLSRVFAACQRFPLQHRDHLCCGNSAAIDFLLEAGRKFGQEESSAGKRLAQMAARKEKLGQFCYLPPSYRDHFEPSLLYGAAGVGYELLRWVDEALPSVLL